MPQYCLYVHTEADRGIKFVGKGGGLMYILCCSVISVKIEYSAVVTDGTNDETFGLFLCHNNVFTYAQRRIEELS